MRRIFAIGETLLDIIFKNGQPVASTPGGSLLNTAVSLGRLGLDVYFISEYGKDVVGNLIDDFLRSNGVKTDYVHRYENYPSSLALAFLDNQNNADYNFYKQYPDRRLDIIFPELTDNDIVVYGSFYGIDLNIFARLKPFLEHANEKNALVIYDPNFRKAHLSEMETYKPIMMQNFAHADIVKGSDEDFMYIFGAKTAKESWKTLSEMCEMLIYTANVNDVELCISDVHELESEPYSVPSINTLSTIGAGDTFNAGLISGLITHGIGKDNLNEMQKSQRAAIVNRAIKFAGHVCMSYENYISREFAEKSYTEENPQHSQVERKTQPCLDEKRIM